MEFNETALTALATLPSEMYQKEGILKVIEPTRNVCYMKRWCRVKDNLLFTFKGENTNSNVYDVTILEQCRIHSDFSLEKISSINNYELFNCLFIISFNNKAYKILEAQCEFERTSWMNVLRQATQENISRDLVLLNKVGYSHQIVSNRDYKDCGFCEISLACENIPLDDYSRLPNCMIVTHIYNAFMNQWIRCNNTEIIEKNADPIFLHSIVYPSYKEMVNKSLVHFTLLNVSELLSNTMVYLGSTVVLLKTINSNVQLRIPLEVKPFSNSFLLVHSHQHTGRLKQIQAIHQQKSFHGVENILPLDKKTKARSCIFKNKNIPSKQYTFAHLVSNPIIKTYHFESDFVRSLHINEFMFESNICFFFPQYLLKMWISDEKLILWKLMSTKIETKLKEQLFMQHLQLLSLYTKAEKCLLKNKFRHFKRSNEKSDTNVEFAPTNLHLQKMSICISPDFIKTYAWITVGAFTSHSVKSKDGGLKKMLPLIDKELERTFTLKQPVLNETVNKKESVSYKKHDNLEYCTACVKISADEKPITNVQEIQRHCTFLYRRNVCFSQALTSLVTGLMTKLWCNETNLPFFKIIAKIGPLVCFECLLSMYEENHMWEDMYVAVKDLQSTKFILVKSKNNSVLPKIIGTSNSFEVHLPIPNSIHDMMPIENVSFNITPVFFSMGVNEKATVAEATGANIQQYESNISSYHTLYDFYCQYKDLNILPEICNKDLDYCMDTLKVMVNSQCPKDIQVLHMSSKIARCLEGLIFVSCKSAKDRTGMFVTLDQTQILLDDFKLVKNDFKIVLNCIRSVGCRMENVFKNIGVRKYAFNSAQIHSLPKLYRPPLGTYGSSET